MIKSSLSRRIALRFVLFTLVLSLVYSLAAIVVAYIAEDQVIANLLDREAEVIEEAYRLTGAVSAPGSPFIQLYVHRDTTPKFLAAHIGESLAGELSVDERHYHFRRLRLGSDAVLVADVTSLLSFSGIRGDLVFMLLLALVFSVIVAVIFAYRLATFTTGPIRDLTNSVLRLSRQYKLDELTEIYDTELDYLVATVESSMVKLNELLLREQAFNKDVSHELRTPLTIIRNQLALGQLRALTCSERVQMQEAVTQIERTVHTLLALARAEVSQPELLELTSVIEEAILAREKSAAGMSVDLPQRIEAYGNRQLAALAVSNLIDNALSHSADGRLSIRYEDGSLIFANPVAQPVEQDVVRPGVAGMHSEGIGHGLYLVHRVLEAMQWHYRLETTEDSFRVSVQPLPGVENHR